MFAKAFKPLKFLFTMSAVWHPINRVLHVGAVSNFRSFGFGDAMPAGPMREHYTR